MTDGLPRSVTLVLIGTDGAVLGALPAFDVEVPWWQEVAPVVDVARTRFGLEVTVLRLLQAPAQGSSGGAVTYLAEVAAPVAGPVAGLQPVPRTVPDHALADHPQRLSYAELGGPAADLAWADDVLTSLGRPRTAAEQVRTWNLSSIWRLSTADGTVWLKVVPPFFAHEGAVIRLLGPRGLPTLLAADGPRVLLDDATGVDLYDATGPTLLRMVDLLVGLQARWVDRLPELSALGLPDWRAPTFPWLAEQTLARTADQLDDVTLRRCQRVVQGLPERFAAIEACGAPDTLVHGDFHTGNLIGGRVGTVDHLTLLDWGDCGVGNPLLDRAAFLPRVPADQRADVRAHWDALWRAAVPGCDPTRAARLIEPVAALRQAIVYDSFVAAIEPSERVYHHHDAARWLRTLADLVQ